MAILYSRALDMTTNCCSGAYCDSTWNVGPVHSCAYHGGHRLTLFLCRRHLCRLKPYHIGEAINPLRPHASAHFVLVQGLTVFQDGVKNLVEKGPKKISPFFIPYSITNM